MIGDLATMRTRHPTRQTPVSRRNHTGPRAFCGGRKPTMTAVPASCATSCSMRPREAKTACPGEGKGGGEAEGGERPSGRTHGREEGSSHPRARQAGFTGHKRYREMIQ